jgi:hypothetical protein
MRLEPRAPRDMTQRRFRRHRPPNGAWVLGAVLSTTLGCAPEVTSVGQWSPQRIWYFEAESGALSGGFAVRADTSASKSAFLEPPEEELADTLPGAARAAYVFSIPDADQFELWGRIRSPGARTNRFWFQVDGGQWYKWRISVGDIWYWDDLHDDTEYGKALSFELDAGEHELVIASAVGGVSLDRLRVSAVDEPAPKNDTRCKPPHSIELQGECFPSCGSQSGTSCGEAACSGKTILEAYDCDVCCRNAP